MIQKYFSITIILISILVVSCRQDNEASNQNEEKSFFSNEALRRDFRQKLDSSNNGYIGQKSDSTSTGLEPSDPPKNGTHYRLSDSLGVYIDTSNPPKNGTHYKSK